MYIEKITLRDFKGFDDLTISFLDEKGGIRMRTLLLGFNGTGKTNILRAIAIILLGGASRYELFGGRPDNWIRKSQSAVSIQASLRTTEGQNINVQASARKPFMGIGLSSSSEFDEEIQLNPSFVFVAGYGASRRLNRNQEFTQTKEQAIFSKRTVNVLSLFDSDARLNPLASWAMSLDYRTDGKGLATIKQTLDYFLEGYTFERIDKENQTLLFRDADGTELRLEDLSDGYQNMAGWIGDLLYRIMDSNPGQTKPLEQAGILLVDEIDLHLHPIWQRKLLDFIRLRLPNFQLIATTHSPLTAQQADEGEVFGLIKEEGQCPRLVPLVGDPKNLLVSQLLMSPVFGLESDEALETEQMKQEYRQLRDKPRHSPSEQQQLEKFSVQLATKPRPARANALISDAEFDLLQKIQRELQNANT